MFFLNELMLLLLVPLLHWHTYILKPFFVVVFNVHRVVVRKERPPAETQTPARLHLALLHPPHLSICHLHLPHPLHPLRNSIPSQPPTSWRKTFTAATGCLDVLCRARIPWRAPSPTQAASPLACMSPLSQRLFASSTAELNRGRSREVELSSTWRSSISQAEAVRVSAAGT